MTLFNFVYNKTRHIFLDLVRIVNSSTN